MTSKEKMFCSYFVQLQNHKEAAIKAGYEPEKADVLGMKLLAQKEVQKQIDKIVFENQKNNLLQKSIAGFERLAFGSITDPIKLLSDKSLENMKDASNLDLFNISEIKKSQNGTVEIKFFDRLKALEKIFEISKLSMEMDMAMAMSMKEDSDSLDLIGAIKQSAKIVSGADNIINNNLKNNFNYGTMDDGNYE